MSVSDSFSATYVEARARFLEAASSAGLRVDSRVHPVRGREGEELAMDVALDGPADSANLLVISSACHGVEGFCGSGVQVAGLRDAAWRSLGRDAGVAVLHVHALNPYGFSHLRRTTHENIDLNRNFQDFSRPLPENPGYRELHPLLVPASWPPDEANQRAVGQYLATRGEGALQAVVSRGQHEFEDGLFFGGKGPSWSNTTIRQVLRQYGSRAARIAWIDFHTGLGPAGVGERIFSARDDAAALARARSWWGGDGRTPITSIYDGSSTSAFLTGMMFNAAYEECPQAEYTGIALEYGTVPMMEVMHALRGDQWLQSHPDAPPALAAGIKRQVRDAFYTDTPQWKQQVLQQGMEAMRQAVAGLAGSPAA